MVLHSENAFSHSTFLRRVFICGNVLPQAIKRVADSLFSTKKTHGKGGVAVQKRKSQIK